VTISPARAFRLRNAVTYAGLLLGMSATVAALNGEPATAGALIAMAVVADTFDGRFARVFTSDPTEERLGVELDSLSDACTFGVAPVVCTVALAASGAAGALCWAGGFLYLTSAVTRLAFYNVTHDGVDGFIGLPAPVAALVWASALCFTDSSHVLAGVLAGAGVAMVAPWRIPRPAGAGLLVFALWPIVVVTGLLAGR
jgi:CDP-diacylglycerol---serine O-phosphatidyltransferase